MTRKRIAGLAVAAGIATIALSAPSATASPYEGPPAKRQYPLCAQEDSFNCIWRADYLGNGYGQSFVSGPRGTRDNHRIWKVSDALAHQLANRHGTWTRPTARQLGDTFDDNHGGSFTVNRRTVISVGGTTYAIRNGRVGVS